VQGVRISNKKNGGGVTRRLRVERWQGRVRDAIYLVGKAGSAAAQTLHNNHNNISTKQRQMPIETSGAALRAPRPRRISYGENGDMVARSTEIEFAAAVCATCALVHGE
jgi:hypothetical protein